MFRIRVKVKVTVRNNR